MGPITIAIFECSKHKACAEDYWAKKTPRQ